MNRPIVLLLGTTTALGLLACMLYGKAEDQEQGRTQWNYASMTTFLSTDGRVNLVFFGDGRRSIEVDSLHDLYRQFGGRKAQSATDFAVIDVFRQLGLQGWELTTILDREVLNIYYFKRPLR